MDFGIANLLDAPKETGTLDRMLTPNYASPEQVRGSAQPTTTGIHSLGAVLYQFLTRKSPTTGAAPSYGIPRDLGPILSKAMREEPEERYASLHLVNGDIEAYLDHRPVPARPGNAFYSGRALAN